MKLYFKILFLLYAGIFLNAQDCKSRLIINSDSTLVNIFINDSLVNTSKQSEIQLLNGKYFVKILEANKIWGANYLIDTLELKNCETRIINFKPGKEVYLDSNPQDAYVFYGDSLIGSTPVFINKAYSNLLLKKSGYADYNYSNNNSNNRIKVNLKFIGQEKKESFFSSTSFKILAGTAVALGAVTAYFKLKADNRFEDYKISRDQNLLDQTNKYDLISGITFTALQINLGYLIYKLFTE
jgi:hypothetical protein